MSYSEVIEKEFAIGQEVGVVCMGSYEIYGILQEVGEEYLILCRNGDKVKAVINLPTIVSVLPRA